ncbi:hypothetical protein INR49_014874 [Caranx melampygus]|nr:hypothetical protein INR49_014874 [Caranx melampygus]
MTTTAKNTLDVINNSKVVRKVSMILSPVTIDTETTYQPPGGNLRPRVYHVAFTYSTTMVERRGVGGLQQIKLSETGSMSVEQAMLMSEIFPLPSVVGGSLCVESRSCQR